MNTYKINYSLNESQISHRPLWRANYQFIEASSEKEAQLKFEKLFSEHEYKITSIDKTGVQ